MSCGLSGVLLQRLHTWEFPPFSICWEEVALDYLSLQSTSQHPCVQGKCRRPPFTLQSL